jgi:hypothetical protein
MAEKITIRNTRWKVVFNYPDDPIYFEGRLIRSDGAYEIWSYTDRILLMTAPFASVRYISEAPE